uniref:Large ribosomal subunit protein uL15/eL18 domain-containing protein n=2 Tax=Pseudo-nitzschia australis TaxID=44445 RepID=A0A7S4EIX8_9STRA|mmetsp:Transcript_18836/g.40984  ORF Transcript_18836/g.40984 Transcript_18836/m.40984 type:complete len:227 (+) Transcript_18836:158-838(+)|eukprot:CAMPEP_0168186584 /NCGR_PEP_ID=MMETSP0139_2-20121125/14524_1 /TAXON_ID=44445 /ORGANISM="Pseudo-nitzschia australis, Strain 10249 10 AB" /LENGTH=226 /DNA_ID=CAMNT_0008108629 /DNA_START=93 /DNA_END=773 /DNA_ORIENTATION=-
MKVAGLILLAGVASTDAFSSFTGTRLTAVPTSAVSSTDLSMKLHDWKRRTADESAINDVESFEFTLDSLRPAPGSRKKKTRKGRGIAAGQGATCGFGMRGQKARSGRPTRPGFEGGQTPLYRRLPKFTGRPMGPGHTKKEYNLIQLDSLNDVAPGTTCSFDTLKEAKAVTKSKFDTHKVVVGRNEFTAKDITVQAHAFTKTARAAIEAAGGKCELLKPSTGEVIAA